MSSGTSTANSTLDASETSMAGGRSVTHTPVRASLGRAVAEARLPDRDGLVVVAGVEHAQRGPLRGEGRAGVERGLRALVLEVHHDVGDRLVVALARPPHHLALQPVGVARRVGRDDHLVRLVDAQGVVEGLERVGVPQVAARREAGRREGASRTRRGARAPPPAGARGRTRASAPSGSGPARAPRPAPLLRRRRGRRPLRPRPVRRRSRWRSRGCGGGSPRARTAGAWPKTAKRSGSR